MTELMLPVRHCSSTAAPPSCGELRVNDSDRPLAYLIFVCMAATLAGFLFGFDAAVINGTVAALSKEFGSSGVGTGFSVASVLVGSAIGALLAGQYAEKMGRKPL